MIIILIEFPYPGHIKPRKEGYLDLDTLTVRRLTHVQPQATSLQELLSALRGTFSYTQSLNELSQKEGDQLSASPVCIFLLAGRKRHGR